MRMENMSDFVGQTREAINALISLEQIWRRKTPDYPLTPEEKGEVMELLDKVKESINRIVESLQGG